MIQLRSEACQTATARCLDIHLWLDWTCFRNYGENSFLVQELWLSFAGNIRTANQWSSVSKKVRECKGTGQGSRISANVALLMRAHGLKLTKGTDENIGELTKILESFTPTETLSDLQAVKLLGPLRRTKPVVGAWLAKLADAMAASLKKRQVAAKPTASAPVPPPPDVLDMTRVVADIWMDVGTEQKVLELLQSLTAKGLLQETDNYVMITRCKLYRNLNREWECQAFAPQARRNIQLRLEIGQSFVNIGDYARATTLFDELLVAAAEKKDTAFWIPWIHFRKSLAQAYAGKPDLAEASFAKSASAWVVADDPVSEMYSRLAKILVFYAVGKYPQAKAELDSVRSKAEADFLAPSRPMVEMEFYALMLGLRNKDLAEQKRAVASMKAYMVDDPSQKFFRLVAAIMAEQFAEKDTAANLAALKGALGEKSYYFSQFQEAFRLAYPLKK
jgi:hypothetical protein